MPIYSFINSWTFCLFVAAWMPENARITHRKHQSKYYIALHMIFNNAVVKEYSYYRNLDVIPTAYLNSFNEIT